MTKDKQQKTIFLFLASRIYMSDLLHTDYIKYLSGKYKVIVFLLEQEGITDPDKQYFKNENITYIKMNLPKSRFWMLFGVYLRNELIHKFDSNPAVKWRNRRVGDRKRLLLRKIAKFLPDFSPNFIFKLETMLVPGYKKFSEYVKKCNPSLVLTAAPGLNDFDTYAILCARRAKISSVAIDTSWDNLTSSPRHIRHVDYFILWNRWMKEMAKDLHGYNESHLFVSGAVRFDHYFRRSDFEVDRETFLKSKGLDPNNKTIFFAARNYGGFYEKFMKAFIQWQKENFFGQKLNLFVRIHPLDSMEPYQEYTDVKNIHIERGGELKQDDKKGGHKVEMNERDFINTKHTLKYCDLCVSIASTMSLEAMIFGKPVINIGFAEEFSSILNFPHYRPVIENGAVKVAYNLDELKKYISLYLNNPDIDKENRKKIIEMLVKPTDGFSYKKNVDFLETILNNKQS